MKTRRSLLVTMFASAAALVLPLGVNAAQGGPSEGEPEGQAQREAGRPGAPSNDVIISARVKSALANVNGVKASDIKVDAQDGVVEISGVVDSQSAKDEAILAVRQIDGIKELKDGLEVRPPRK